MLLLKQYLKESIDSFRQKRDSVIEKKIQSYDSKIFGDDSSHSQDHDSLDSSRASNQSKRIEQILFKQLYQKTIDKGQIDFNSKEDMEVMISAMQKKVKSSKEKTFIISAISQIGVFAHHPMIFQQESVTSQLFREIKIEHYSKRSTIFNQGDIGDTYYMLMKGEVYCLIPTSKLQQKVEELLIKKLKKRKKRMNTTQKPDAAQQAEDKMLDLTDEEFLSQKFPTFKLVKTFKQWEGFGDIALITQQYRTATMVCKEDSYCITMTKPGFDKIIGELSRQQKITQVKFLKQFPFFNGIPKSKLMSILMDIEVTKYAKNKVLYEEGQPITHVFFILEGEVEIYKKLNVEMNSGNLLQEYEKQKKKLSQLNNAVGAKNIIQNIRQIGLSIIGPNSYFGVDELFNGKHVRESSARCITPQTTLYVLNKEKFLDSLKVYKQLDKNQSNCVERDYMLEERAQNMTDLIQNSLQRICNNVSVTYQEEVEEPPEKKLKPLTKPREIIKERIILNKEIVPDRMIKQNSILNQDQNSKQNNQGDILGQQSIFKQSQSIASTFYLERSSSIQDANPNSTGQTKNFYRTQRQLKTVSYLSKYKDEEKQNLETNPQQDTNETFESEKSEIKFNVCTPLSPQDSQIKITDYFANLQNSAEKIKSTKDVTLQAPELMNKYPSIVSSKFQHSTNNSSTLIPSQKVKISLSKSTIITTRQESKEKLNETHYSKNELENPFNKEEMKMKIDFCEKVNFEKMNRYVSYMKNNNMLKNILNDNKKKVTPSNHMKNYFNSYSKKQNNFNMNLSANLSSHTNMAHDGQQSPSPPASLLLTEKEKAFLHQSQSVNHTHIDSVLNTPQATLDTYTQQELTRLQYLNQYMNLQKGKQNNQTTPYFFSTSYNNNNSKNQTSAEQIHQKVFQQRSKKISPSNFFQDLFLKKEQNKIVNAEYKMQKFNEEISTKRKNISLNWQQNLLLRDEYYLDNVNKQDLKGSPIQHYIDNKYSFNSGRKHSDNTFLDTTSNRSQKHNETAKEVLDMTQSTEKKRSKFERPKLQFKTAILKPLSEFSSPLFSRKLSIADNLSQTDEVLKSD